MKKIFALLMAAVLTAGMLFSCGDKEEGAANGGEGAVAADFIIQRIPARPVCFSTRTWFGYFSSS